MCASSGAEAIQLFESENPDMVLSDLLMPEMDGYELHRILQEKSFETVPMMFMTVDESDESESHGFEINDRFFKLVNDLHGHKMGDKIQNCFR